MKTKVKKKMENKNKRRKVLESCPTCGEGLQITQLQCGTCDTTIQSHYEPCRFCRLSPESLHLIELFVKSRGNVKEMERELGLSYPTVRAHLDTAIRELGFDAAAASESEVVDKKDLRREILARLEEGQIKATEAAEELAQLGSTS
ncbi:MAG: DUF2089 family protein [Candidatus Latescibacterota bacterium]|jgi:hypothetical protein